MDEEIFYNSGYSGTKKFHQKDVKTANAVGFGAAADDFMERGIDLNEQLIKNNPATYFFKMNSDAMIGASIHIGDTLIVDRSIKACNGKIILAIVEGELLVRRMVKNFNSTVLVAENRKFSDIHLSVFDDRANVWGVVTYVIHQV